MKKGGKTNFGDLSLFVWCMLTLALKFDRCTVKLCVRPSTNAFDYYITGDERGRKKWPKYKWSAGKKFNTSYRDISVVVSESNSVVKPKCEQYTSLNKMWNNFSKVLMAHISFTAILNNAGIGEGIGCIRKGTKKNYIYVL